MAPLLLMQVIVRSHPACLVQTSRLASDEEAEEYTHQDGVVPPAALPTSNLFAEPALEFTEIGSMPVPRFGRRANGSGSSPQQQPAEVKYQGLVDDGTVASTALSAFHTDGSRGSNHIYGGGNSSTGAIGSGTNIDRGWFRKQLAMLSLWHCTGRLLWHTKGTKTLLQSQITSGLLINTGNETLSDSWSLFLAILASLSVFICLPLSIHYMSVSRRTHPNNFSDLFAAATDSWTPAGCPSPQHKEPPRICPELCVPQNKECRLHVPQLFEANTKAYIRNSQGAMILSANLSCSTEHSDVSISLMSPDEQRCFALCKQVEPGVLSIHPAQTSKPAVELRRDTCKGRFCLDTSCGSRLLVNCHMQTGTMEVINDNRLMAVAVPDFNRKFGELEICVGPGIDVSLMVLTILGIEFFLGEGKTGQQSSMSSRTPSRISA